MKKDIHPEYREVVFLDAAANFSFLTRSCVELVAFVRESGEAGLEEVVHPGGTERPGEQSSEPRRDDLSRAERRCDPRADAAAAGYELPDCLPHPATLERILLAFVRVPLDERLAQEARHLVARQRARRLVGRERERHEVERRVLVGVAAERTREGARGRQPAATRVRVRVAA